MERAGWMERAARLARRRWPERWWLAWRRWLARQAVVGWAPIRPIRLVGMARVGLGALLLPVCLCVPLSVSLQLSLWLWRLDLWLSLRAVYFDAGSGPGGAGSAVLLVLL
jgi:hypothetical protein